MSEPTFSFLIGFLRRLEQVVPPPENCHHAICLTSFKHNELSLSVQVNTDGKFATFLLEKDDLSGDPEELADRIFASVETSRYKHEVGKRSPISWRMD